MPRSNRAVQIVLALAFVAAGVLKIVDPPAFALSIARLRLAPETTIGALAIILPWLEVVSGAALFLPKFRPAALYLLASLLLVFTGVLGIALLRGTAASCGCFGSGDAFLNRTDVALARNVVLLAAAGFLLVRKPTSPAAPASPA
jgi:uncharacterized membrane protein YphA (DoxX/SURF4 family)